MQTCVPNIIAEYKNSVLNFPTRQSRTVEKNMAKQLLLIWLEIVELMCNYYK